MKYLNENQYRIAQSKLTEQFIYEDNNKESEVTSFETGSDNNKVKMYSKEDENGKTHYYKKVDGKDVEIDKIDFDRELRHHEEDVERAKKLKQDTIEQQKELLKKTEEILNSNKDKKQTDSKSDEPSQTRKAWDGILDTLASSQSSLLGMILGHTGKIVTAVVSDIVKASKEHISKKKEEKENETNLLMLANMRMQLEKNIAQLQSEEEKAAATETLNTINRTTRCLVDKNGKIVPLKDREKILKGDMTDEEWNDFKTNQLKAFEKTKDMNGFDDFDDLSKMSDEEFMDLENYKKKVQREAHNDTANEIEEEIRKKREEENKRYENELKHIQNEKTEEETGLENYKKDVETKKKELDSLKKEDGETDETFEARKAKIQKEHDDAVKNLNDKTDELGKRYEDKESEARENHKTRQQEIQNEYNERMKEAGLNTVDSLVKDAEKQTNSNDDNEEDVDDEEQEGDSERELDTSDMEDEDKGNTKQDPHKVWKRKTYKRGDKTMKTKSYYNKSGNSISADDFKDKVRKYKETQAKNESLGAYLKVRLLNENLNIDKYLKRETK